MSLLTSSRSVVHGVRGVGSRMIRRDRANYSKYKKRVYEQDSTRNFFCGGTYLSVGSLVLAGHT